jgi:DNA repair exonuclease SbcCD ATPase subunit
METSSTQENTQEATQGTETPQAHVYSEAEYNALKAQLDTAKSQLDTANAEIQSYKDMDIDNIKASVAEYKQKWEQSEADRKAFEYQTRLGQYVKTLGLRDDIYEQHVARLHPQICVNLRSSV